jgi:hypothetical protein
MKKIIIPKIFICLFIILCTSAYAQNKVEYDYDNKGNRKLRKTCLTCRLTHNPTHPSSEGTASIQADTIIAIKHGVQLFPNPTQSKVNLNLSNLKDNEMAEVIVSDENGKTLYSAKNLQSENEINMAGFNNGTYFVRVTMGKDVLIYKVMKLQ